MPASLDSFISAELFQWGALKIVADEAKADCIAAFGKGAGVDVRSSGSAVVPSGTTISAESPSSDLPEGYVGFGSRAQMAAVQIIHKKSSVLVWATAKSEGTFRTGGAKLLAKMIVGQLKKDFRKAK
jgi:hypothetical protein